MQRLYKVSQNDRREKSTWIYFFEGFVIVLENHTQSDRSVATMHLARTFPGGRSSLPVTR